MSDANRDARSVFDYRPCDLAALLAWHELFGWPAVRALSRASDAAAAVDAALNRARGSLMLVAVGSTAARP